MATCLDLRERFGRQYRLSWEADGATRTQWAPEDRPWLLQLSCRRGVIYPVGGEQLAAYTEQPRIGAQLRKLPCVVSARGDVEVTITFHVDQIDAVLEILKPRRRRHVSGEQRERLTARLRGVRGARPPDETHGV